MDIRKALKERKKTRFVIPENDGKKIFISGFVESIRSVGKKLKFMVVRDSEGAVQATFLGRNFEDLKAIDSITGQSVVVIEGIIQKTELSNMGVELIATDFEVVSLSDPILPIDNSEDIESSFDSRMNWRHVDLRNPKRMLAIKLLSEFERYAREFFYENGLTEIHSSKLMASASEGGAEVFRVDYFGKHAYLAQSPQFYKQMAISSGMDSVFEIGPVFRAEKSFTSRHVTEFTSMDVEIGYISSFEDVMDFEEMLIRHVIERIANGWAEMAGILLGAELTVPAAPFPRITMEEAIKIVKGMKIETSGEDLGAAGEKALHEFVMKKYGHDFVFVTHFPWNARPFYHMRAKDDPGVTLSYDLLWKGIEITTGAQREHRYAVLKDQAAEKGLSVGNLKNYLDFFRYGCPPHGGFGLGMERFVSSMLGLGNVREAVFTPRDPKRLTP